MPAFETKHNRQSFLFPRLFYVAQTPSHQTFFSRIHFKTPFRIIVLLNTQAMLLHMRARTRVCVRVSLEERERERENSNSKTLFYKDCSLGSVKNLTISPC